MDSSVVLIAIALLLSGILCVVTIKERSDWNLGQLIFVSLFIFVFAMIIAFGIDYIHSEVTNSYWYQINIKYG